MKGGAEAREAAVREIFAAFGDVTRNGGVSLHEAQVIDDYGSDDQRKKARSLDRDKKWVEVPDRDIEYHGSALNFMDAIGFRYYLPAYMVWALRNYETSDSISVDHVIYCLNPSTKPSIRTWQLERFAILSKAQAQAILTFLRYMAEHSDGRADDGAANEAIHDYWADRAKADS